MPTAIRSPVPIWSFAVPIRMVLNLGRSEAFQSPRSRSRAQGTGARATKAKGWASLAEEASVAYKDVSDVVRVSEEAGLCKAVVRLRPLGVIKG